jgi:hypothetical protein
MTQPTEGHLKEHLMTTIHLHEHTTSTPEQFIAGLTDFGPGRHELFPNSADDELQVHSVGAHEADVTEGGKGTWERLTYDWSDPQRVVLTTTDSNVWGGHSGYVYTLKPQFDGGTDIDVTIVREGKNLKGRLLGALLRTGGKHVLGGAFETTVKAIESRDNGHAQEARHE